MMLQLVPGDSGRHHILSLSMLRTATACAQQGADLNGHYTMSLVPPPASYLTILDRGTGLF